MSRILYLHSTTRDRDKYPNPFDFVVSGGKEEGWNPYPVKVCDDIQEDKQKYNVVEILDVIIPYVADLMADDSNGNLLLALTTRDRGTSSNVITNLQGNAKTVNFVLKRVEIIVDPTDEKTRMRYVGLHPIIMPFVFSDIGMKFYTSEGEEIYLEDNGTEPDRYAQITSVISVLPYNRDNSYTHYLETRNIPNYNEMRLNR